jgi:hypothetical protein
MIAWDEAVVDAIARRRAVLVVGSGVSRNSTNDKGERPLSWDGFLRQCAVEYGDPSHLLEVIGRRDYLLGCQLLKSLMGRKKFVERVQSEFQLKRFRPADIHKHLYELDVAISISPNFDNIYDDYCRQASDGSYVIKTHTSLDTISYLNRSDVRLLIKSHGSANDPDDLIFTAEDYSRARTKYSLFYDIVRSLALTHTFVFIGCGVDDPDLRMLFEDIQFTYGRSPTHFMTIPSGEVAPEVLKELGTVMCVKHLIYSSEGGHVELTESLAALAQSVEQRREMLSKGRSW